MAIFNPNFQNQLIQQQMLQSFQLQQQAIPQSNGLGQLFPFLPQTLNPFNSTLMWGSNPYSAAFNQAPATMSYINPLLMAVGHVGVNSQPPSDFGGSITALMMNPALNQFGTTGFIPQQQLFAGPPPFTVQFMV